MRFPFLALAVLAAGCRAASTGAGEDLPGMLTVTWSGADSGQFSAPAQAGWCAADTVLQVTAVSGDTGVGLALYAADTIAATQHPVIAPGMTVDWRPLGAVALRWFATTEVLGYEGTSGVVSVTPSDSGPTGTVDVRLKRVGHPDTLRLTGRFTALSVEPMDGPCGRAGTRQPG